MTHKEELHELKVLIRQLNSTKSKIETMLSTLEKKRICLEKNKVKK